MSCHLYVPNVKCHIASPVQRIGRVSQFFSFFACFFVLFSTIVTNKDEYLKVSRTSVNGVGENAFGKKTRKKVTRTNYNGLALSVKRKRLTIILTYCSSLYNL